MSQNQSYFWQTTRHNVYLKRTARLHMWLALMAVLTYATICTAEISPEIMMNNNRVVRQAIENTETTGGQIEVNIPATNEALETDRTQKLKDGFVDAFTASISVIILTELGDKTFFIAAIMAMRHPRLIVFSGAIFALALMTVISCVFGMAATIIPKIYTYYISIALFAIFGLKMLYDGYSMKPTDAQDELEEVQSDLRKREDELLRKTGRKYDDADVKRKNSNSDKDSDIGAGADEALISHHTKAKTSSSTNNNNNNNTEMQHRQRKQRNNKKANCDNGTTEIGLRRDSEVFLTKDGAIVELKTFHQSSPALSESLALSEQTQQTMLMCDSPLMNMNGVREHGNHTNAAATAEVLVHSAGGGGTANKTNQRAPIAAGESMQSLSGISLTTPPHETAGQATNGDLKQRLDRDVNAALVKDPESGILRRMKRKSNAYVSTRIFVQAFTMTFLAEWGDRSQLTTIILAASKNVYGVIFGGVLGHAICTGLAVIGGRIVAAKISVRTVTIVGGIVFIGFAIYGLIMPPDDL